MPSFSFKTASVAVSCLLKLSFRIASRHDKKSFRASVATSTASASDSFSYSFNYSFQELQKASEASSRQV